MLSHQRILSSTKKRGLTLPPPALGAPIEEHANYAYEAIYKDPYRDDSLPAWKKPKKREHHGIPHVARVAINIPAFANLYRRHGDQEALALTHEDLKLIQIAAIFHDCARKGDGADEWDKQSAWSLYLYLTEGLKVDANKAKLLAEAIANKDAEGSYFELELTPDNITGSKQNGTGSTHRWVEKTNVKHKNIYQKLIHDADCLDVIRARDCFEAEHLDFYKEIAINNNAAFNEMAKLISEGKSLIERHGDSRHRIQATIKRKYENGEAYQRMMSDIQTNKQGYKMYNALLADHTLLTGEGLTRQILPDYSTYEYKEINAESLTAAMTNGDLFARGVGAPAATATVRTKDDATAATIEIKKITRKKGNLNRSGSFILPGSSVYVGVGFLTVKPDLEDIVSISETDADTGRGKNKYLPASTLSQEEKARQIKELIRREKMGGSAKQHKHAHYTDTHNETTMHIKRVDAVYFSEDPTTFNMLTTGNSYPPNPQTQYLQALHLQQKHKLKTGITLPIVEYSAHGFIKETPGYTDDEIVKMWVDMIINLIKNKLKENNEITDSMDKLLIEAIYGNTHVYKMGLIRKKFVPNKHYTPELKARITAALENAKTQCLHEHERNMHMIKAINEGSLSVLSEDAFKMLLENPHLIEAVESTIKNACDTFFDRNNEERMEMLATVSHRPLTQDNYFNTDMAKVCFYALTFNPKLAAIIQLMAKKRIEKKLILLDQMLDQKGNVSDNLTQVVMDLTDCAIRADLLDQLKEDINNAIQNVIDYLFENNDVANFKSLVLDLHKAGVLKGELLGNCLEKLAKLKLEMDIKNPTDTFISYANNLKQKIKDNMKEKTVATQERARPRLTVSMPSHSRDALFSPNCMKSPRPGIGGTPHHGKRASMHDDNSNPSPMKSPRTVS